jgi:PHD/YefM family antitoxin component YafN of YafNO toxin-antitoxin module
MGDEAINDAMKDIATRKRIVTILKNNKDFFNIIKEQLLQNDEDYLYDLKNDNNLLKSFEKSIKEGHIQWLIDKTKNHNRTTFNSKYTIRDCDNIDPAYCDFYKIFSKEINNMELSQSAKYILSEYIKTLIDKYCH